jgi:hypothetical protein
MARLNREMMAAGMAPEEVAERVFEAVREEQFYVLTHRDSSLGPVKARLATIVEGRDPQLV